MSAPKKKPWLKFYPADWRADPRLRVCSLAGRGLWIDLMAYMHEGQPYGHLTIDGRAPDEAEIAALVARPLSEVRKALSELRRKNIFSVTTEGVIYSRRMVRDHAKAERDRSNGSTGGNPDLVGDDNPPDKGGDNEGVNPPDNPAVNRGDKAHIPEARVQKENIRAVAPRRPHGRQNRFQEFWAAFPKRDGANPKAKAEKLYTAAVKSGVAEQTIIDAAKLCSDDYRRRNEWGSRFVPRATTWLSEQRWGDETGKPQQARDSEPDWGACVRAFRAGAPWVWKGPEPGQAGCLVPPDVLSANGFGTQQPPDFSTGGTA